MPEIKFTKDTDAEHEIKLDSHLIYANWRQGIAYGGQVAKLEVGTSFVGNGAAIKIKGKSEKGKKLGKISDVINNNVYVGEFEIPEDIELGDQIYFEVKLSKNSLEGESNHIPAFPPIKVSNLKWSAKEARRGDILTLTSDIEGMEPGDEVTITIYEYDADGAHDRITELPGFVKDNKIEVMWEYEYHEDTDEIPSDEEMQKFGNSYNPPEYFFALKIGDTEYGLDQESGILTFKDWIEITLKDDNGSVVPNAKYTLLLPDGTKREGNLDSDGYAREEGAPPGAVKIEFPDLKQVTVSTAADQKDTK